MGSWTTTVGDRVIFGLDVATGPAGPKVTWIRPQHFQSDGNRFWSVRGPVVRRKAVGVLDRGDLTVSFDDPRLGATPDVLRLHCRAPGRLTVAFEGSGFEPFDFTRVPSGSALPGPWQSATTYQRTVDRPTSAEMTAIFEADQTDRQRPDIDWSVVGPADERRRKRTQELLDTDALHSGQDFYHAAYVFQHGGEPNDYLKAHLLATVAVARNMPAATWIAAATLDRYLQAIGKPQVLGTQFRIPRGEAATQEPYDRTLLSDAVRAALRVPPIAEQEKRRDAMTRDARAPKTPSPRAR